MVFIFVKSLLLHMCFFQDDVVLGFVLAFLFIAMLLGGVLSPSFIHGLLREIAFSLLPIVVTIVGLFEMPFVCCKFMSYTSFVVMFSSCI